ncbi:Developmental regulator, ULTRAPETALA [Trema orientale]|uniref:Developmental regulator, ULTRAPETALA n=1 Tax=Trema orientale TaxID=63057 RepID=A0A2P5D581_TREOI|nr:Developmental regulator, ULTRAPETALA [Trema orientale]
MLSDEKLKDMDGLRRGTDYIEVTCGCTSKRLGDFIGKLKVFTSGQFLIACHCTEDCDEGKLNPEEFEKHSSREGPKKWKRNIWVKANGVKVPLWRSGLLKYYKHGSNIPNGGCSSRRKWNIHRDEFICCSRCKKERRFRLRTKEECRIFHDASAKRRWKCSDRPYDIITCEEEEERESRKSCRGCPRTPACKGCTSCVCFGCLRCRFFDCNCRTCVDFMQNAAP